jgi:myosin heavy subunit
MDDVEEFKATIHAMDVMGFSAQEKSNILKIIAGILALGNLKFEPGVGEGSVISNKDELETAATVLEVDANKLDLGLCKPR